MACVFNIIKHFTVLSESVHVKLTEIFSEVCVHVHIMFMNHYHGIEQLGMYPSATFC